MKRKQAHTENTQQTQWKNRTWQIVETSADMEGNKGVRHNGCGGNAEVPPVPFAKDDSCLQRPLALAKVAYTGRTPQRGHLGHRTGYPTDISSSRQNLYWLYSSYSGLSTCPQGTFPPSSKLWKYHLEGATAARHSLPWEHESAITETQTVIA